MADPIQNPFDDNMIDRLEEAVDLSRLLVGNAQNLRSVLRSTGETLDREYLSATRSISKHLNEIAAQFSKLSVYEFKRNDAIKLQVKLEKDIQNVIRESNKLRDNVLPALEAHARAAELQYNSLRSQLGSQATLNVQQRASLDIARDRALQAQAVLDTQVTALDLADEVLEVSREEQETLANYIQNWDKVNFKLGLTGRLVKSLASTPFLKDLVDAKGALQDMEKAALENKSTFNVLGTGIKTAFQGIEKSVLILGLLAVAVKTIEFFVKAMIEADKQVTDIAKNLGISKESARETRDEFFTIVDKAEELATIERGRVILQKELVASNFEFNKLLGVSVDLTSTLGENGQQLLVQYTNIVKALKLTEEEQKGLLTYNILTGKEVEDINKSLLGNARLYKLQTGYQINEKKVLTEILTVSNAIKLSTKGGTDAIKEAVLYTQHLGISLSKVENIAAGFLDFENSIQAQLEAELLTSRKLNLSKIQYAALTNDQVTVTKELNRLVAEAGPDLEKNRIAQESLAKALNVSREELADMITQQKVMNATRSAYIKLGMEERELIVSQANLSGDVAKNLIKGTLSGVELYNILVKAGKSAEQMTDMFGSQAMAALGSQSAQEKFTDALEKAKEAFTRFVDGGMIDKLSDIFASLVNTLSNSGVGGLWSVFGKSDFEKEREAQTLARAQETVKQYQGTQNLTSSQQAALDTAKSIIEESRRAEDRAATRISAMSYGGGGLSVKDFVIKSLPEDTVVSAGGTSLGNTKEMISLLKEQNQMLSKLLEKDTSIYMDGQKVSTGVARNAAMSYGNLLNPSSKTYS